MLYIRKKALLTASALLITLAMSGCAPKQYQTTDMTLFNTVTVIKGYADSRESFDATAGEILELLGQYHRLYDVYYEYSGENNLRTINLEAGQTVEVSAPITEMLRHSVDAYALTGGRVNVAMGSVLSLWHDAREAALDDPESARLPSREALEAAALHTDINNIIIDGNTVRLADPEMSLDVGATAKGFAVEAVCAAMEAKGVTGYLVNVGGNIRAIGGKPDGGWRIGVTGAEGEALCTLSLESMAAVTSGTDKRYFTVDGVRYHHIIDPDTLYPSDHYASVTVVSPDSGLADALSTGLFNMELEEGMALVESIEGMEALWVLPDGETAQSPGFGGYVVK